MAPDPRNPILSPISVPLPFTRDGASPRNPPLSEDDIGRGNASTVGEAILCSYATHIDPLQTNGETHSTSEHVQISERPIARHRVTSPSEDTFRDSPGDPPATALAHLYLSKSHPTHRRHSRSTDIPHQTIIKALASRTLIQPPLTAPLGSSFGTLKPGRVAENNKENRFRLSTTSLQLNLPSTLSATASMLLKSPCFFHQRLEGAVDMQKLLEDSFDDDFSHSRLMQTATTVRESAKHLKRRPIKKAVLTVMIVTRARDNKLVCQTRELAEWLLSTPRYGKDIGVKVYVDAKLRHSKRFDADGLIQKDPRFQAMLSYWTPDLCWSNPDTFDLVLTLGGDGTVLFTSWLFQRTVPPILSFSMGSLGFLTNFAFDDYRQHLDRTMGDAGMRVNLRMRFTCTVWRADRSPGADPVAVEEGEQFEVLNELVIDRGPSPYVSNLELWGDDSLLTRVQADGCILSTPTGSTAYSLSAGGALVHPDIPAILLTPICPHTLSFRPMLLSDTVSLRIVVPLKARSSVYCSFDGKGRVELNRGDNVTLEASQYPFPTVMTNSNEWIESVQRSLHWNVRGAEQKGWEEGEEKEGTENEVWDIDTDTTAYEGADSGLGQSEDGDQGTTSPMRHQMSLLNM
jgi:NAD+ kinase